MNVRECKKEARRGVKKGGRRLVNGGGLESKEDGVRKREGSFRCVLLRRLSQHYCFEGVYKSLKGRPQAYFTDREGGGMEDFLEERSIAKVPRMRRGIRKKQQRRDYAD